MTAIHYYKIDDEQPALPVSPTHSHTKDDEQPDQLAPGTHCHEIDNEQPDTSIPLTTTAHLQIDRSSLILRLLHLTHQLFETVSLSSS